MRMKHLATFCLLTLGAGWPPLAPARGEPDPAEVPPLVAGTRKVLAAIVRAGQDNARQTGRQRLDGDELTVLYVRVAAAAARDLPREQAAGAFLVGLGLGL